MLAAERSTGCGVVSAFQDMTSPRSHRLALTEAQALFELSRCAGTHFDAAVVSAFRDALLASAVGASRGGPGPQIATNAQAVG